VPLSGETQQPAFRPYGCVFSFFFTHLVPCFPLIAFLIPLHHSPQLTCSLYFLFFEACWRLYRRRDYSFPFDFSAPPHFFFCWRRQCLLPGYVRSSFEARLSCTDVKTPQNASPPSSVLSSILPPPFFLLLTSLRNTPNSSQPSLIFQPFPCPLSPPQANRLYPIPPTFARR